MVSHRKSLLFSTVVLIIFMTLLLAYHDQHFVAAMRPLEGDQWTNKEDNRLAFQSLQQGPLPPSGRNPCSTIPGQSSGVCTLNGKNFAGGRVALEPPAFPSFVMDVGVASIARS
ncbi:hypothetical protein Dsin_024906 [Dipteronia sinensis]|uniref:Uncharacterized protein n=1 Tax=Dipteronia sinensis TaxID=43782 RepID=A0AAD9ZVD4_9ROSI|nr:hypothetical protein Dsin_024906 [Dipteronia sinensis]